MREVEVGLTQSLSEFDLKLNTDFEPQAEILGARTELARFKDLGFDGKPSRQTRD